MRQLYILLTFLLIGSSSLAQTNIVFWNFDEATLSPSEGVGSAERIGGTQGNGGLEFFDGMYNIHTFPDQGTNSGTAGMQFTTSAAGFTDIEFTIDIDGSNGASKFFEVQSSIDGGTTWQLVAEAEHMTLQNEMETFGPYQVTGADNASSLRIRIVTVFEEGTGQYTPIDNLSTYSIWDTYSFDNVKITGVGSGGDVYCEYNAVTVNPITFFEVTDSGLSNTTSNTSTEAHEYFLEQVANVYHGNEYLIKLAGVSGNSQDAYFTLFIDWNKNGVLDDEGEVYELGFYPNPTGDTNNQLWGSFIVPMNVSFGPTRMRVINNRDAYALDPCGEYQFGQAEDYTISVNQVPDDYCVYTSENVLPITNVEFAGIDNQTETPSIISHEYFLDEQAQVERGESYSITLEGDTGGNNTDYFTLFVDWNKNDTLDDEGEVYELGTLSNSTGTDGSQLLAPFSVEDDAPLGPTRIRIIKNRGSYATDSCGEYEFGQAEEYTINITNPEPNDDPYCEVEFDYGVEPITYVNFAGIDNRSSASTSSPAHEYFLEMQAVVDKNEEYEITLEGNTNGGWDNSFTVFVDWNQNGSLDDTGERYDLGTIEDSTGEDGQQLTADILVPAFALSGETRLRVFKDYGSNGPATSCYPVTPPGPYESSGQVEDYTIVINSGCEAPSLTIEADSIEACEGTSAVLEAETNGGQVFWFDSEDAVTPIGSGITFETPILTETTSFWAEATSGEFFDGGRTEPESFDGAQVNQTTSPWGLVFNTNEIITLNSVDVYIADEEGGEITVQLLDENWDEVQSTTVTLPVGHPGNPLKFEIPLGFVIPEGDNYRLVIESSPMLVRELVHQHAGFPYELGDSGEITGGTLNNGGTNSTYYFFYNWKFNTGDSECKSDRVEVSVTVNPAPDAPVGDQTQFFILGETLSDLEVTGDNLIWYEDEFGGTVIPQTTELVDGTTYYVSQNNGECESGLLAITVYLQLGVSDLNDAEFAYYPNPVKDVLNISGKTNVSKIEIFDLSGKQIISRNANAKNIQLNLSSLISGTYVVKVSSESITETFKIIKK